MSESENITEWGKKVLYLIDRLKEIGAWRPTEVDRKDLIRHTMDILGCSYSTARQYANFLLIIDKYARPHFVK